MKDAIQYTVTVTATIERRETLGRMWGKLDSKPASHDADKLVDVMGWLPETQGVTRKEVEILKQTVDDLDVAELVGVINQLPTRVDAVVRMV